MSNTRDQIAGLHTLAKRSDRLTACTNTEAGTVCAHLNNETSSYSLDGDAVSYSDLIERIESAKTLIRLIQPHTQ